MCSKKHQVLPSHAQTSLRLWHSKGYVIVIITISNKTRMTSKFAKNKKMAQEPLASVLLMFFLHFDLTYFFYTWKEKKNYKLPYRLEDNFQFRHFPIYKRYDSSLLLCFSLSSLPTVSRKHILRPSLAQDIVIA